MIYSEADLERVARAVAAVCAHCLVDVARDYRSRYGRNAEQIVCLPLKDGIEAIRSLSATELLERARGLRP